MFACLDSDPADVNIARMPAHTARKAIGSNTKSDGTPTTALDWLGNHTADKLAKDAAAAGKVHPTTISRIASTKKAISAWRKRSGRITCTSQRFCIHVTGIEGNPPRLGRQTFWKPGSCRC